MVRPTVRAVEKKVKIRVEGQRRFESGSYKVNEMEISNSMCLKMSTKIKNHFKTPINIRTSSCQHIILTIWYKSNTFFLFFILNSGLFLIFFFNFSLFSCFFLNAYELDCGRPSRLAPLNFIV